jgi:hypothetical protein
MTASAYCYWLQGFIELHGELPTATQWASIKEHLALVFTKVTKPGPGELPTYCGRVFDGSAAPDSEKLCNLNLVARDSWDHTPILNPDRPGFVTVFKDDQGVSGICREVPIDSVAGRQAIKDLEAIAARDKNPHPSQHKIPFPEMTKQVFRHRD